MTGFIKAELEIVASLLGKRYGKAVHFEEVECEIDLGSGPEPCPAIYWCERGANFVVVKINRKFICQFFYSDAEHFGTGREEYRDLEDCVTALLRVQADHESGALVLSPSTDAEDYQGPSMI